LKVGLIVPGFSAHEQDWCIPALLDYVRVLAAHSDVHVFTLRWPERGGRYPVFGATVHAMDGRKQMGAKVMDLWLRAFRELAAEHRRAPFDVLHAFWADEPGWVAAWVGERLRVPVIISLAGGELVGLPELGYGSQLLRGRGKLIRWGLKRSEYATVGSDYLLGLARTHLPVSRWGKLKRAPLGVDTEMFAPGTPPPSPPRSTEGGETPPLAPPRNGKGGGVFLNAGSLYPVKGHILLMRAFATMLGASESRLRIAGDGPLRAELKKLAVRLGIAARVEFMGEINHGQMPDVYRQADVYAQASWHESQGMAALEAAACGLPVVGTAVGVLPEIGTAVPVGNVQALAEAMCAALREEETEGNKGSRGNVETRGRLEAEFSLAAALERFLVLYRALKIV